MAARPIDERELGARVEAAAGLRQARDRERAIGATLVALRAALAEDDARVLADSLPRALSRLLERRTGMAVRRATDLYAQVERREQRGRGFAMEHAQAVLGALARSLDPEVVDRLRRHLPSDIAVLLRAPAHYPAPAPYVHSHPATRPVDVQTLSRARPGASQTIAEASGPLAHTKSVARTPGGHSERMVETARSTRPGREDETLASTRAPARRR